MTNVWFSSDFHLGHRNIIRYCDRPFESTQDMDATILANLNRKVGVNDILYFLETFAWVEWIRRGCTETVLPAATST